MSPLLALFEHGAMSELSPLSGVKRKLDFGAVRAAFDLRFVKTCTSQECAELFSLSSSLSSGRKHFWFSNLRNREGVSTRRLNVGVFTRPRPTADIGSQPGKWPDRSSNAIRDAWNVGSRPPPRVWASRQSRTSLPFKPARASSGESRTMDLNPDDTVYPVAKIALVLDALAAEGVPKEDALRRVRLSEV